MKTVHNRISSSPNAYNTRIFFDRILSGWIQSRNKRRLRIPRHHDIKPSPLRCHSQVFSKADSAYTSRSWVGITKSFQYSHALRQSVFESHGIYFKAQSDRARKLHILAEPQKINQVDGARKDGGRNWV